MDYLRVKSGPQEFICAQGVWDTLAEELEIRQLEKILVLHGDKSWAVATPYFPELKQVTVHFHHYRHHCTDSNRDYFVKLAKELGVDTIIAVGGGKVSDLAKAVAYQLQLAVIMLPTLASTCAAYTPLSVIYDEEGSLARMDYYNRGITLTLVDPSIILQSPPELLVAGIGDTLAKWYEADAIIGHLEKVPLEVEIAHLAAKKCQKTLMADSEAALTAIRTQTLNDAFVKVVETNIMLAGMVGGFGDKYGRTAGSHSLHDALTHIPAARSLLHGKLVAYGSLVQLVIEDKWSEVKKLVPFYQQIDLPTSLQELGLELTIADVELVSQKAALPDEPIHLLQAEITAEVVSEAIYGLEKYRS